MIFDSHVHFFPDKLQGRVLPKLSQIAGCPYYTDERRGSLLELISAQGITHCLALHIATNPSQQTAVNNFAAESQQGPVLCFGSVHPASADWADELHRIKALGLRGVKFHPDYQGFFAGDEDYFPIYEVCQKLTLPIAFHAGRDPYSPQAVHCPPSAIAKIARAFPRLTLIAAHMGGLDMTEQVLQVLCGLRNVYFDTAFAASFLSTHTLAQLIRLHGADRVLFATDAPWSTPERELALVQSAGLTAKEKTQILWENACTLFGLSQSDQRLALQ